MTLKPFSSLHPGFSSPVKWILILLLFPSCNVAQSLKSEVDNIYNFSPSKLSKSAQDAKMPALDGFWAKVKSDTGTWLPPLRNELRAAGHHPFFYYDGAGLLMSLSHGMPDKELAVQSMTKCNLNDIDHRIYVSALNQLARDGINVTNAAIKILADPKFSFFLPEHAMNFTQDYCLAYMLLPQKPAFYSDTLVSLFGKLDAATQKSIITTFWLAYTCKGDSLINASIRDKSLKKDVSTYAGDLMSKATLSEAEKKYVQSEGQNIASIRENALKRFSDEAVDDLALSTKILRSESKCR